MRLPAAVSGNNLSGARWSRRLLAAASVVVGDADGTGREPAACNWIQGALAGILDAARVAARLPHAKPV